MAKEVVPASDQKAKYLNILQHRGLATNFWNPHLGRQARGASQLRLPIPRQIELGHPVAHGHTAESIISVEKPASVVQESKQWRTANAGGELPAVLQGNHGKSMTSDYYRHKSHHVWSSQLQQTDRSTWRLRGSRTHGASVFLAMHANPALLALLPV